jgi:TP901 family phage tail tape measure protein
MMDNRRLRADMVQATTMFTRFGRTATTSLGSVTGSIKGMVGAFAGFAAVSGAIKIFKGMIDVGAEFQQTMVTTAAVMRATGDEFEALSMKAREMGESTEFTATQAGDALRFLGMAGFNAADAIKALPGVLDLATASASDLARTADIASNALTAMQLPVEQLNRVNDVFVGTTNRANVNMEQMAEAFKFAAPIAQAFGYEIEELSGLIGTLGDAGVQGSMAGTQLAMAIQKANEVAVDMRMESSDLIDVLDELGRQGATNADLMQLFGIRAGRAALILKNAIPEVRAFQRTLMGVGGEAAAQAEKMRATFQGAKAEMISVFQSIAEEAFGVFGRGLEDLVRGITNFFRRNRQVIVAFIRVITDSLKILIGAFSVALQIVEALVGGMVAGFGSIATAIDSTTEDIKKSAMAMAAAMEPPPIDPWNELIVGIQHLLGKNLLNSALFIVKSVATAVAGVIRLIFTLVNSVGRMIEGLVHTVIMLPQALATLDFGPISNNLTRLRDSIIGDFDRLGTNMQQVMLGHWDQLIADFETRSPAEIIRSGFLDSVGADLDRVLKPLEDTDALKALRDELAESGTKIKDLGAVWSSYRLLRNIQIDEEKKNLIALGNSADVVAKIVSARLRQVADEIKGLEGDLFDPSKAVLAPTLTGDGGLEAVQQQIMLYQQLLQSGDLTASQLAVIWEKYKAKRIEQIEALAKLEKDPIVAEAIMITGTRGLEQEGQQFKQMRETIINAPIQGRVAFYEDLLSSGKLTRQQILDTFDSMYRDIELLEPALRDQLEELKLEDWQVDLGVEIITEGLQEQLNKALTEISNTKALGMQVKIYRELLSSGRNTIEELGDLWKGYYALRLKEIDLYAKRLMESKTPIELIHKIVKKMTDDLEAEQEELFQKQKSTIMRYMEEIATGARDTLKQSFTELIMKDFATLDDWFLALRDRIRRILAQIMADMVVSGIFDLGKNIMGGLGGGSRSSGFNAASVANVFGSLNSKAEGGFVSTPQLAIVGDRPEVIVPVHRFNDEAWWSRLGINAGGSGESGGVTVVQNITTPDTASFQRSQTQIASAASTAMGQAARRNG